MKNLRESIRKTIFEELEINILNGKSKESAKTIIYKVFRKFDHGQIYRDDSWQNVKVIFNAFAQNNIQFEILKAEYNPGGISVDVTTPQWKRWDMVFNFTDKNNKSIQLPFNLTANAAGTISDPWEAYDITFYSLS